MENKIRFSEVLKKYTMVIVLALVIILFTVNTGGKMLLPLHETEAIVYPGGKSFLYGTK